jgi:hypothetical protein
MRLYARSISVFNTVCVVADRRKRQNKPAVIKQYFFFPRSWQYGVACTTACNITPIIICGLKWIYPWKYCQSHRLRDPASRPVSRLTASISFLTAVPRHISGDSPSHHLVLCSIIFRQIDQFQGLMEDILVYTLRNSTCSIAAEKIAR